MKTDKKTAVEWLVEVLTECDSRVYNSTHQFELSKEYFTFLVNEAKEIERQQIIEAHGNKQKTKSNPNSIVTYGYTYTGEMYFNDNFNTNK